MANENYQRGNPIPQWKKTFMRVNAPEMTAGEIAKAIDVSECKVYAYCNELGIQTKKSEWFKANRKSTTVIAHHPNRVRPNYQNAIVKPSNRPSAVYSNKNHWE